MKKDTALEKGHKSSLSGMLTVLYYYRQQNKSFRFVAAHIVMIVQVDKN